MLKTFAALVVVLALAGCGAWDGMTRPVHGERAVSTEAPAVLAARVAIDEANATLTALNNVIGQNVADQVWTKAQAQSYLDESRDFGAKVDRARELLRAGLLSDAKSQADAVRSLVLILHRRVAAAARGGK